MVDSMLQTIATELQRANAHLAQHQAEQQKQMNAWRQEVEQYQAELQEEGAIKGHDMSKYQAEVSRETARIQGELAEYQANIAKKYQAFNARIQKEIQKYQWYQSQLAYVQQMYEQCWAPYQGAMTDQNTSYARPRK
jgi:Skp family chaperone for outer membrane proteins